MKNVGAGAQGTRRADDLQHPRPADQPGRRAEHPDGRVPPRSGRHPGARAAAARAPSTRSSSTAATAWTRSRSARRRWSANSGTARSASTRSTPRTSACTMASNRALKVETPAAVEGAAAGGARQRARAGARHRRCSMPARRSMPRTSRRRMADGVALAREALASRRGAWRSCDAVRRRAAQGAGHAHERHPAPDRRGQARRDQPRAPASRPAALRRDADAARRAARFRRGAAARRSTGGRAAVIAEIKKASPSKGVLREKFVPAEIAASYERHGAAALSVLTDAQFFQGALAFLAAGARRVVAAGAAQGLHRRRRTRSYESRALGADCILLIAAVLDDAQMARPRSAAPTSSAWPCWSRSTTRAELERALRLRTPLRRHQQPQPADFEVTLDTTLDLLPRRAGGPAAGHRERHPGGRATSNACGDAGVHAFLVGEAFMRAPDPGAGAGRTVRRDAPTICAAVFSTLPPAWAAVLPGWTRSAGKTSAIRRRPASRRRRGRSLRPIRSARSGWSRRTRCKVVVFGQDPYPTAGHADGLAFSAGRGKPRSLARIFEVLARDRPGLRAAAKPGRSMPGRDRGVLAAESRADGRSRAQRQPSALRLASAHSPDCRDSMSAVTRRRCFCLWGAKAQSFFAALGARLPDA